MEKKILLVEDDLNLGIVTKDFLEMEGFSVDHCQDGESGKTSFFNRNYQLVIIDIMLPRLDGFALAREIREKDRQVPLIFLTAKSMKEDKIRGFKAGADDYITKPFSTEELALRINAVLRRTTGEVSETETERPVFAFGKFTFDYPEQMLHINNKTIQLTRKEADVLRMLCKYQNKLLKRDVALKEIWSENDYFMGRSMDVYIAKLRKLLREDPSISIINVHNSGFKLSVE
ncbi:MAG: response regulator transcription factor [Bacteroidales bacterium]|nr:response regulator transcription factor [Bacteroidales bacterium]